MDKITFILNGYDCIVKYVPQIYDLLIDLF